MQIVKPLPNPFRMNNGKNVQNKEDWEIRREEIRNLILEVEYGNMPGAPEEVQIIQVSETKLEGEKYFEELQIRFIPQKAQPNLYFDLNVSIRFPLQECIEERKEVIPSFGKEGLPCMIYIGNSTSFEMFDNGYITIMFQNDQLEPMKMGNPTPGPVKKVYEQLEPGKYTWGSIAVWAWGAIRLLEYALTREEINPEQILVSGHSRNGKAALLAGALEDRFTLVNPAGSGCAGAGSYLVIGEGAESIASLTDRRRWWNWTQKDFEQFAYEFRGESQQKLTFDQHFVMALVAPRALLRTEGRADFWANPEGTSAMFLATEPIYEFLNVSEKNQCYFRPGGHQQNHEDMMALISFADWCFFGLEQKRIFKDSVLNHPMQPHIIDWVRPEI